MRCSTTTSARSTYPNDPPLPGLQSSTFAGRVWDGTRGLFAKLFGRSGPAGGKGAPVVALEAGIGMSVSYDGGLTWTGGFMPGLPFDRSPASVNSPGFGLEGMSDPVAISAPCGRFYVAYLQFSRITRQSKLMVARFQDLNDHDLRHTFRFLGSSVIETGMNSTNGHFVDKPEMALRLTGATSCSQVTEHVFVTFTTFTGQGTGGKFQSKINLASSTNLGASWAISKVDDNYTESQGTAVVTHPVTGQVSVVWRSFNSPHSMVLRRQASNGTWAKPVDLLANDPLKTLAIFDQRGMSTTDVPTVGTSIKNELAFRSNAFPVAAFTPDGSALIVAWHEKVNGQGLPDVNGSPRIVWKYSRDGGTTWSQRRALVADRPASPGGLGFFNPTASAPFPQVMPSIACGAGAPNRCVVTYYEARGGLSQNGLIAGYNRLLDLRAVMIDAPANANPTPGSSFQVSRYAYRPLAENETPQETLDYVQQNCRPDGTNCRAAMHTATDPHTSGGTTPFIGDYNYVAAFEQIMKDPATGVWRLAKTAQDVPGGARFITAFADNRNVQQPFEDFTHAPLPSGTGWNSYPIYGPAGLGGSCFNPGSRDQNVMTAHISTGLLVTAPTNFKPFPAGAQRIEFPMTIWNNTGVDRQFGLDLMGNGSFAKVPSVDGSYLYPLKEGGVTVFAYSSASVNVYALDGNKVTVNVTECGLTNCASPVTSPLTGSISFNAPSAAPPNPTSEFTYTASNIVVNPVPKNPVPKNPVPKNPVPKNPVPKNAITGEPVPVYDIIDYSWTVNPASQDDGGTYLALANIDRAYQNDYVFQVFVTKPSTLYSALNCQPGNLSLGTLVGHISDPQNPVPKNPVPKNPVPKNPVPKNAALSDQLVSNTTFTLESSDTVTAPTTFSALAVTGLGCDPTTGAGLIGECTMAAPRPPNETTITVRAYQITQFPSVIFDPHGDLTGTATPPSVTVADYWCTSAAEGCPFTQDGPDLAVPDPPTPPPNVTPTTVRAGQTVTFPVTPAYVFNIGNKPAKEHRLGYYVSAASTIATLPRRSDGTLDTSSSVYTRLLHTVNMAVAVPLAPGAFETITSQTLTIPADIPRPNNGQGTYYLYAFDDDLRRVNELNEDNNIIQGGPITVQAPGYTGIIGLFSPCSGLSCSKNAGSALPIAFQLTFDGTNPANSQATKPRLRVYAPGAGGACVTSVPANGSGYLFLADDDNVSSGNSLWQYFATAGSRPAFTWQSQLPGEESDDRGESGARVLLVFRRGSGDRSDCWLARWSDHQTEHHAAVSVRGRPVVAAAPFSVTSLSASSVGGHLLPADRADPHWRAGRGSARSTAARRPRQGPAGPSPASNRPVAGTEGSACRRKKRPSPRLDASGRYPARPSPPCSAESRRKAFRAESAPAMYRGA